HLRAGESLFQPLAGDRVDAAFGRGGDDVVAALAQDGDRLRADQTGAADDDDFHGLTSIVLFFLGWMPCGRRSRSRTRSSSEPRAVPRDSAACRRPESPPIALRGEVKNTGATATIIATATIMMMRRPSARTCGLKSQPLFPAKTNPKGGWLHAGNAVLTAAKWCIGWASHDGRTTPP